MTSPARLAALAAGLVVAACAPSPAVRAPVSITLPATEPVYAPDQVRSGQLSYAPDGSTFAPILTERFAFPTQRQANDAYGRLVAERTFPSPLAASVRLFGCKPGAFDPRATRILRYRSPIVHCATDFLDGAGRALGRVTANFRYDGSLWRMDPVYPRREPVPWLDRERSPRDLWGWIPGRDRYE